VPEYTQLVQLVWLLTRGVDWSPLGSPKLWPRLEGEEVRGLTSVAVPADVTVITSVDTVKALPVPAVQKPPRRVGKQFRDRLEAAPEGKE
jgi:hypothetical protein